MNIRSERGAMLVMVSVALLGLTAFSAIVIDYGLMLSGRGQIQTAADAGALAGALAVAFDDDDDFEAAKEKAQAMAQANFVMGNVPEVLLTDVTFPPCPPGAPGLPDGCIKVNAFRNQERNNPLPVFFGTLVGVADQGVVATATAQIASAKMTECLRPWAILDRWEEFGGPFQPDSTYDRYADGAPGPAQEDDLYLPPGVDESRPDGTGYTVADAGLQFAIKETEPNSDLSPGWFKAISIPRLETGQGADEYRSNIIGCGGYPTSWFTPFTDEFGVSYDDCPTNINSGDDEERAFWAEHGCFAVEPGNKGGPGGPTAQGVEAMLAREPRDLHWVGGIGGHVEDSAHPGVAVWESPRIVPVPVVDIDDFLAQDPNGNGPVVKVVNIFGFFIEGMGTADSDGNITVPEANGKDVIGRLVRLVGTGISDHPSNSTFLRTVLLVR